MDTILESGEAGNKATVIFHAQETSGGMVNSVNGNFTVDDGTYIEHASFYITNTAVPPEGNREYQRSIYPTRPPPNGADTNTDIDTIVAPSRGVRQPQHPGAFKPSNNHIDADVAVQSSFPPGSDNSSLIEIQVIADIMDALIENPSLRHSAKLPETLATLHRILQLTKFAFRVYQHSPLAKTINVIIISEAALCRQHLMALLSSLGNYRHALSAAMLHFIREYVWSSATECTAFNELNSRLRECHGSFAACILAVGSLASAELEWGTGTGDFTELHNFSVLFKQESTSLQHIRIDTVIVIDHLARHLPVPTVFCQSWKDFNVVITGFCKDSAGGTLIQRGDYRILNSEDDKVINRLDFSTVLQPGMTVEMSVVLHEREEESVYGSEEHRCPRCGHLNSKVVTPSGWVSCRNCYGRFQNPREDDIMISPAVQQAENNPLPEDRSFFRRISVLKGGARETDAAVEETADKQDGMLAPPSWLSVLFNRPRKFKSDTESTQAIHRRSERWSAASTQGMHGQSERSSAASIQGMHRQSERSSAASTRGMHRQSERSSAASSQGMYRSFERSSAASTQGMHRQSERSSAASSQGMYRPFERPSAASTQGMRGQSERSSAASNRGMHRPFERRLAASTQGMHRPFERPLAASIQGMHRQSPFERSSAASTQGMHRQSERSLAARTQGMHRQSERSLAASTQAMYRQSERSPARTLSAADAGFSALRNGAASRQSGWTLKSLFTKASSKSGNAATGTPPTLHPPIPGLPPALRSPISSGLSTTPHYHVTTAGLSPTLHARLAPGSTLTNNRHISIPPHVTIVAKNTSNRKLSFWKKRT